MVGVNYIERAFNGNLCTVGHIIFKNHCKKVLLFEMPKLLAIWPNKEIKFVWSYLIF